MWHVVEIFVNLKKNEIIVFRAWILAQIVANRETRLSRLILGRGGDYSWNYGRQYLTGHTRGDLFRTLTNLKIEDFFLRPAVKKAIILLLS